MGAASAEHPAYHYRFSLHGTRRTEALRLSGRHPRRATSALHTIGDRRGAGILRRAAPSSWSLHPPRCLHSLGGDGCSLFSGPCAEGVLAIGESRGIGRALLFRISLPVSRRRWPVEP